MRIRYDLFQQFQSTLFSGILNRDVVDLPYAGRGIVEPITAEISQVRRCRLWEREYRSHPLCFLAMVTGAGKPMHSGALRSQAAYATSSSTPERPKWRAFIPTSHRMTMPIYELIMSQGMKRLNQEDYWHVK